MDDLGIHTRARRRKVEPTLNAVITTSTTQTPIATNKKNGFITQVATTRGAVNTKATRTQPLQKEKKKTTLEKKSKREITIVKKTSATLQNSRARLVKIPGNLKTSPANPPKKLSKFVGDKSAKTNVKKSKTSQVSLIKLSTQTNQSILTHGRSGNRKRVLNAADSLTPSNKRPRVTTQLAVISRPSRKGSAAPIIIPVTRPKKSRSDSECPRATANALKRKLKQDSQDDGNSDDEGSVESAVLEENICFHCGKVTKDELDYNTLILCDCCDGEYHLSCLGLDMVPRAAFRCPKCSKEGLAFEKIKFNVDADGSFKIPRRKSSDPPLSISYSPSRPLDLAWEECVGKGLMLVSDLFSVEVMRTLTHGPVNKLTQSGRVAETWSGAAKEISKRLKCGGHNVVNRGGRLEITVPSFVVNDLRLNEILEPILSRLRTVMGHHPEPEIRTHNIVFAPVGSAAQEWHCDDSFRKGKTHHRYFTILIHLNPLDSLCGGTEIWCRHLGRLDLIRARPGDAFVFNGSLLHRGQANRGFSHRFFYYASFACRADANTEM